MARQYISQNVNCMKFEELNDVDTYDGIWTCASILHIEKNNLLSVLIKMINALKTNGIIYTFFKLGIGYEIKENKYYNYLTKDEMVQILEKNRKES